jgi:hypothetical protein
MNNLWLPALAGKCPMRLLQKVADERATVWLCQPGLLN